MLVQSKEVSKSHNTESKWLTRRIEPKPTAKLTGLKTSPHRFEPKNMSVRKDVKFPLERTSANKSPITQIKTGESTEDVRTNSNKTESKNFLESKVITSQNKVILNTFTECDNSSFQNLESKETLMNTLYETNSTSQVDKDFIINTLNQPVFSTQDKIVTTMQANVTSDSNLALASKKYAGFSFLGSNSRYLSKSLKSLHHESDVIGDISQNNDIKGSVLSKDDIPLKVPKLVITKGKRLEQVCQTVEKINLANSKAKRQLDEKVEITHSLEPPKKVTRQHLKSVEHTIPALKETVTNNEIDQQLKSIKQEIPDSKVQNSDVYLSEPIKKIGLTFKMQQKNKIKKYLLSKKNHIHNKQYSTEIPTQIETISTTEKIKNNSNTYSPSKKKLVSKPKRVDPITIALNNIRKYDSVRKLRGKNLRSTFNLDDDNLRRKKKRRSLRASAIANRKALAHNMKVSKEKNNDNSAISGQISSCLTKTDISTSLKNKKVNLHKIKDETSLGKDLIEKYMTEQSRSKLKEQNFMRFNCKSTPKSFSEKHKATSNLKKEEKSYLSTKLNFYKNQDLNQGANPNGKLEIEPKRAELNKKEIKLVLSDTTLSKPKSYGESLTESVSEEKIACSKDSPKSHVSVKQSLDSRVSNSFVAMRTIPKNATFKAGKDLNLVLDSEDLEKQTDLDLFCHETDLSPEPVACSVPRVKNRRKPIKVFKSLPNPAEQDLGLKEPKTSTLEDSPDKFFNNTVKQFTILVDESIIDTSSLKYSHRKQSDMRSLNNDNVLCDPSGEKNTFFPPKRNLFKLRPRLLPNTNFQVQRVSSVFEVDVDEEDIEQEELVVRNSSVVDIRKGESKDNSDSDAEDIPKFVESTNKCEQSIEKKTLYHRILEQQKVLKPLTRSKEEIRIGDVVWGRCHGYGWWPGLVISLETCVDSTSSDRKAQVNWLNSTTQSKMSCKDLNLFIPHFDKHFKRKSSKTLKMAVIEAQKACEEKYGIL